ncbi:phosphotriesterase family protein [Alteribacillus bidgolensis]|uniref:Phosphotriesterase-related protein n=1 Tax=Alteribacillus bidgolensis TaxID=930129 RepID=A0A1G8E6J3_9BACI|nr:phosphotriesterase [Alteribacillus bidgolensis]SDH65572.1 phosphotriesterase-related protein [Alteribacillus bidgolensis]
MQTVQTVLGEVDIDELGITLMHEHLLVDRRHLWKKPAHISDNFAYADVSMTILNELRHEPYSNFDNNYYLDTDLAAEEVKVFQKVGGRSIVDVTPVGIGRNPESLKDIAVKTNSPIIMGCGYYLENTHPSFISSSSAEEIAECIYQDLFEGAGETNIKAGIIGEIGIGPNMTDQEVKVLRGAAKAQKQTGKILTVHLPGWERYGHSVLDIIEKEGANPEQVILDHMNPSLNDIEYQTSLADRGAFLEYDMIGIELLFPEGQSPSDQQSAEAIVKLLEKGYESSILLSQDVFLKSLLKHYGGGGFAHILQHFVPRLKRLGVSDTEIDQLLIENPKQVFKRAEG